MIGEFIIQNQMHRSKVNLSKQSIWDVTYSVDKIMRDVATTINKDFSKDVYH